MAKDEEENVALRESLESCDEIERWLDEHCPAVARGGLATIRRTLRRQDLLIDRAWKYVQAAAQKDAGAKRLLVALAALVEGFDDPREDFDPPALPDNPVPGPTQIGDIDKTH